MLLHPYLSYTSYYNKCKKWIVYVYRFQRHSGNKEREEWTDKRKSIKYYTASHKIVQRNFSFNSWSSLLKVINVSLSMTFTFLKMNNFEHFTTFTRLSSDRLSWPSHALECIFVLWPSHAFKCTITLTNYVWNVWSNVSYFKQSTHFLFGDFHLSTHRVSAVVYPNNQHSVWRFCCYKTFLSRNQSNIWK